MRWPSASRSIEPSERRSTVTRSTPTLRQRQLDRAADAAGAEDEGMADAVGAEPLDGLDRGRHVGVVADEPAALARRRC